MKRFIDLRGQIGDGSRFAWYDTVCDCFETHAGGSWTWETWAQFEADLGPGSDVERYRELTPAWAFRSPGPLPDAAPADDLATALAVIRELFGAPAVCRKAAEIHLGEEGVEPQRDWLADWIEKRVTRGSWLDAADLMERYPEPIETIDPAPFPVAPTPVNAPYDVSADLRAMKAAMVRDVGVPSPDKVVVPLNGPSDADLRAVCGLRPEDVVRVVGRYGGPPPTSPATPGTAPSPVS